MAPGPFTLCVPGGTRELFQDGYDVSTGKRIYDRVAGMTCHQCRQKTLGLHTSCSQCETLHVRASPPSSSADRLRMHAQPLAVPHSTNTHATSAPGPSFLLAGPIHLSG